MRRLARLTGSIVAVATTLALGVTVLEQPADAKAPANPVTPGNFTGYGFDQCLAPTQASMDRWWLASPFSAVGIYISGDSRACTNQPNLTPGWISHTLATGWKLLPITLGPQASCTTRPRYLKQVRINASTRNNYAKARAQGTAEADKTVGVATGLGIAKGSTLWYDIEAFNISQTACRESAKQFLSAWTAELRAQGYKSGIYSSAASGIKMLDQARANGEKLTLPDQLWIADWNGKADVYSTYVSNDGWMPHARVHQYRGGHNETHGGVTINIDSNWLDLGKGSTPTREGSHCGGVSYNFPSYGYLAAGTKNTTQVKTLQCLLKGRKIYTGAVDGQFNPELLTAINTFRAQQGWRPRSSWTKPAWMALLSDGATPTIKYGAFGPTVRRLQRTLNASGIAGLTVTGVFDGPTMAAVKKYQKAHGLQQWGTATPYTWKLLRTGQR